MTSRTKTTQTPTSADEKAPWETFDGLPAPTPVEEQQIEPAEPVVEGVVDDPMQTLMDWCVEYSEISAIDNAAVMAAEVRRIMAGEDAEEVLGESAPLNGKDHAGKIFLLHGFTLNPSDHTDGWPFYAAMDCTDATQNAHWVMNCGGPKVVAALKRLHEIGEYPYAVKIEAKETRAGRTVLALVAAGK